jgi:hypothetical protein
MKHTTGPDKGIDDGEVDDRPFKQPHRTAPQQERATLFALERAKRIRVYKPSGDLHYDCFCGAPAAVEIAADQIRIGEWISGQIQLCRECAELVGRRAAES